MRTTLTTFILILLGSFIQAQVSISASSNTGCTPLGVTISVTSPDASDISSYSWEITTPSGAINTASSPSYVGIFVESGGYDVSLTINGTDNVTIEDFIVVYDLPNADFTVDDNIGCFPLCVNFSDLTTISGGEIIEWSWDFGNGLTSFDQNPTNCYNATGSYTPLLSIEDENGCFSDISFPGLIEVVDQFPTPDFTSSSILDCNPPVDIQFTNNSTGYSNLTSTWDFGDGNSVSNSDLSSVSNIYNSSGTYQACLFLEDEIGCTADSCIEIEIFETADSEFITDFNEICAGQFIQFTDQTVINPPLFQWDFDGDGTVDSNEQNPVFQYATEGTYFPTLTVYYSDNCEDTQISLDPIDVFEALTVDFSADSTAACSLPFTVNFTNESTGSGTLTYEWYIDGVLVGTDTDLSYEFDTFGDYDVELITSNDIGCEISLLQSNMINLAQPIVLIVNPEEMCLSNNVVLLNFNISVTDPIIEYLWDYNNDGIVDATGQSPEYYFDSAGDYNIFLTVNTENGCTATSLGNDMTVFEPLEPTFTISETEVCAEQLVDFCVDGLTEDINATWNFGDTENLYSVNFDDPCYLYHYADTGMFDVTLTVFSAGCTFDTIIENAINIWGPVASFSNLVNCADNLTVTFEDTSIAADSLIWDFGDGTAFVHNDTMPTHTYPDFGTYLVTLYTFNDSTGCEDISSGEIILSIIDPSLTFDPTSGCPPLEVSFENVNTYPIWSADFGNGTTFNVEYNDLANNWYVTLNNNGDIDNYFINGSSPPVFPDVIYEDIGTYDVTVTATDENGCSETLVYPDAIEVNSSPDFATFSINPINICDEMTYNFDPDLTDLVDVEWTFSTGALSTIYSPDISFLMPYDSSVVVTLSASDTEGCTSIVTEEFEIILPPIPLFSISTEAHCTGDILEINNESTGDIISYSWDFGDPASAEFNASNEENPTHQYTENGTYDVCLTIEGAGGCVLEYCMVNAVVINTPEPSFTYDPGVNNCLWGVQFENTTDGTIDCSDWDFGDGQIGTGISPFHTYPIGVYDVQLVVCNEFGCVDSIFVEDILNYGNVIGPFSQELDDTPCAPFNAEFEAFNILDNTFDYFWDFDNGFGDTGGNTITEHDYLEPGVYCPSLIMTDPSGCAVLIECIDSIYVEEFTLVTSEIDELCFGDTLLYTVDGGDSYLWDDMTFITEIDEESFWIHPNATSDFSLFSTLSDCETTVEFTVVVHELPIVTIDNMPNVCQYDDDYDLVTGMPNDLPGIYYVNGIIESEFSPSWDSDQNYEIEYLYTDLNGCFDSAFDDVYINTLPEVILNPFDNLCGNDGEMILSGGGPINGDYFINDSLATTFNPQTLTGINNIEYIYTDANGCVNQDNQDILVSPVPVVDFELGPPCEDTEVWLINHSFINSGSIDSVYWDFGIAGISNDFDPLPFIISNSGMYDISLELFSDMGCSDELIYEFQVFENPVSTFDSYNLCQNEDLIIEDLSTSLEGEITSWSWLINDEIVLNEQDFNVTMSTWGDQNITLVIETENGCIDSLAQVVDVYPAPLIDFEFDNNCLEEVSLIQNTTDIPETIIDTYNWNLGDGNTSNEEFLITHIYDEPGTYLINLEAITQYGCSSVDSANITIHPLPEIEFIISDQIVCQFGIIDFEGNVNIPEPYSISDIQWSIDNEEVSNDYEFTDFIENVGFSTVSLWAITNTGCSSILTEEDIITVNPTPFASFDFYDDDLNITNANIEIIDQSIGALYYEYDFGDGTTSTDPEPNHLYNDYIEYTLIQYVSNEFGCQDTAYNYIFIDQDVTVFVPNSFTPDGDGLNEVFIPVLTGFDVAYYNFQIFNRWGELIFETTDPEEGWNGDVYNGEYYAIDGIYEWKLQVRAEDKAEIFGYRGSVTKLR